MRDSRYDPISRPALREAPAAVMAMARGARVRHSKFGVGTVEGADGQGAQLKLTVRFPAVGVKVILARFLEPA